MTDDEKIKICKYCKKTEKEIINERKITNKRSFCYDRGTPKGFHKFIIIKKGLIEE